jgi:hypothetical protein
MVCCRRSSNERPAGSGTRSGSDSPFPRLPASRCERGIDGEVACSIGNRSAHERPCGGASACNDAPIGPPSRSGGALSVPGGVVIATKAGLNAFQPGHWLEAELLAAGGPARVPAPGGGDEDAPHAAGPESISCGCVASTRRCRCRTRSASPKGSRTRARSGASVLCGVAVDQLSAAQGDRGDRVDPEPMQPGRSVRTARVGLLHRPRHRVHSYRPLASGSLAGEGSPLGERPTVTAAVGKQPVVVAAANAARPTAGAVAVPKRLEYRSRGVIGSGRWLRARDRSRFNPGAGKTRRRRGRHAVGAAQSARATPSLPHSLAKRRPRRCLGAHSDRGPAARPPQHAATTDRRRYVAAWAPQARTTGPARPAAQARHADGSAPPATRPSSSAR